MLWILILLSLEYEIAQKERLNELQEIIEDEKLAAAQNHIKLTLMNSTRAHWVPNRSAKQ